MWEPQVNRLCFLAPVLQGTTQALHSPSQGGSWPSHPNSRGGRNSKQRSLGKKAEPIQIPTLCILRRQMAVAGKPLV